MSLPPLVVSGLALATKVPKRIENAPLTIKQFARKHIVSSRVLGISYLGMALLAKEHHALNVAGATALWACGFVGFEPKLNREIIPDIRGVLKHKKNSPSQHL